MNKSTAILSNYRFLGLLWLCLLGFLLLVPSSCQEKDPVVIFMEDAVTDYDGNTYNAVQIGKQVWMQENLRTTHYADGLPIDSNSYFPVNDYYKFPPDSTPDEYGLLYSATAASLIRSQNSEENSDIQGVCPDGWHVPSRYEWVQLSRYVGKYTDDVVGALSSTIGWQEDTNHIHDSANINSFAFSALPSRKIDYYPDSKPIACFWSSTSYKHDDYTLIKYGSNYDMFILDYYSQTQFKILHYGDFGFASVRCIRDKQ